MVGSGVSLRRGGRLLQAAADLAVGDAEQALHARVVAKVEERLALAMVAVDRNRRITAASEA